MLEARFQQAALLKKLLDAIKELVTDANVCKGQHINKDAQRQSLSFF